MHRPFSATLIVTIASIGLALLYGGAPLAIAIPGGGLIWLLSRRVTAATGILSTILGALVATYPAYIALIQLSYWRAGQQGIDFGIFSQVIYQVGEKNLFITSLISTEWQNFLTHHFSPFLVLLGAVAKCGLSPEVILIGAHTISVACLVWGLKRLWSGAEVPSQTLVLAATALLLPGVRRALGWETHDEVLALPLIVWSLVAHLKGRDRLALLLLFPPLLFKETFGLVMCITALAYACDRTFLVKSASRTARLAPLAIAMFGAGFFLVVTEVLPGWVWMSTFDLSTRIATVPELFSVELLGAKLRWAVVTFLPAVPFLFLHTRRTLLASVVLVAPALPSIAAVAVTNFAPMMDPYNYYSITPGVIVLVAASLPILRHPAVSWPIAASLCLALVCGGTVRSSKIVRAGFAEQSVYAEIRAFVPKGSAVIADDYTTSVLADSAFLQRVFHARRTHSSFDYVVVAKTSSEQLSKALKQRSVECYETPRYLIRCREQ